MNAGHHILLKVVGYIFEKKYLGHKSRLAHQPRNVQVAQSRYLRTAFVMYYIIVHAFLHFVTVVHCGPTGAGRNARTLANGIVVRVYAL